MKRKYFYGVAIFFFSILFVQACTNDYTFNSEDQALKSDLQPVPATKYCKYNVSKSSAEGLSKGDIACIPFPKGITINSGSIGNRKSSGR